MSRLPSALFAFLFLVSADSVGAQTAAKVEAEPETPIDLGTALKLAGVQNPEIQLARERVTEAAALRMYAAAQILPNINAGTNYDLHRGNFQQSNGTIIKENRDSLYLGLGAGAVGAGTVTIPGLQYNLNVGTAWYNALRAKQVVARQAAAAKTAEQAVLLNVGHAYCELLRAETRRAIAVQNKTEAEELVRLTEAYAKAGQGRQADADRARVELRLREGELAQADADLPIASARLARLLSLDPTTRLKPNDGWAVPAPIVPDPLPLKELIAIALMQRPELTERRAEIQEALYALANAKLLPFSPTVILGFSAGTFGGGSNIVAAEGQSRFGNFAGRTDLDAAAVWTLQNFGAGNVALIRAGQSRVRQNDFRQVETLDRVRTEVAVSKARVDARLLQIDIAARAVQVSQSAFKEDVVRIRGQLGLPIEVIDSMRLLARSRREYIDAIIDYNRGQFQLYVDIGQPPADRLVRAVPPDLIQPATASPKAPAPGKP